MTDLSRRQFSKQTVSALLTYSLLETLFGRDMLGAEIKPVTAQWIKDLHEMGVDLQRPEAENTEGGRGARAGRESPGAAKLQGGRRLPLEDASPESSPRRCGQGLGAHRVGADPRSLSQKSPLPGGERVRVRGTA